LDLFCADDFGIFGDGDSVMAATQDDGDGGKLSNRQQSTFQPCQSSFQGFKLIFEEPMLGVIVAIAALDQSVAFGRIEDMTMACIIGHEH
jgi:hypothetical protein